MMICLEAEKLSYTYPQGNTAIKEVSFKLQAGRCLGIIGLNGCGKTTLCYCLCGIIPHFFKGIMEGRVLVNGKDTRNSLLHTMAGEIGLVLQDPNDQLLMPTVEDELAFGLENYGIARAEMRERIYRTMDLLGITGIKDEHPQRLSGGEKQLVALAAVLTLQPSIIVFDESLSMLDEQACMKIKLAMKRLKEEGNTLVIVDHTMQAFDLFDEVLVMEEGKIVYHGDGQYLLKDRNFLQMHRLIL